MKNKIIYNFTNIAPHYRKNLWQKLVETTVFDFHFFYGGNKKLAIKEIDFSKKEFNGFEKKLHKLKNIWVHGRVLVWQKGVLKSCLKDKIDTAIFLGEFQVISTWLAMLICKIRGIQVVYWTHGLYGNESFLKKILRLLFYKTADKLLLYERRAKRLLIKSGFEATKLHVVFNSLDYDAHIRVRQNLKTTNVYADHFNNNYPTLVFIGRLTSVKKLELLLEAQTQLTQDNININVIFVGDGPEKNRLEALANKLGIAHFCWFYGACYNEVVIAELIYNAVMCVSPGNVGLTAIHALSYGTPICTHNNFSNQMPEYEVVEKGITGTFFKENSSFDLKLVIAHWLITNPNKDIVKNNCFQVIDQYYNPYYQTNVICNLINREDPFI